MPGGKSNPIVTRAAKKFRCVTCSRPDTADDIVACDKCHSWWHYSCAGVSDSVKSREWICSRCIPVPPKSVSIMTSSSTRKARIELELKQLAEKRELEKKQMELDLERKFMQKKYKLLEEHLADEELERRSTRSHSSAVQSQERTKEWVENNPDARIPLSGAEGEDGNNLQQEAVADFDQGAVGGRTNDEATQQDAKSYQEQPALTTEAQTIEFLQQQIAQLQEQIRMFQLQADQRAKSQQKVPALVVPTGAIPKTTSKTINYELNGLTGVKRGTVPPEQLRNVAPSVNGKFNQIKDFFQTKEKEEEHPRLSQIAPSIATPTHFSERAKAAPAFEGNGRSSQPGIQQIPVSSRGVASKTEANRRPVEQLRNIAPPATHAPNSPAVLAETLQSRLSTGPTHEQMAARQVLPKDLPTFTGNPADWPVFISNYNYTTEACGYSNGENMTRLQLCLKGAAWESVRSRLILPESVPNVIESLRMRFGRADLLIESLIENVKSFPAPRADKLETLVEFGTMVQTLCDHIVAAKLLDHLANPTLLKDLVSKLPAEYRMRWATHRKYHTTVNLKTFGDFMEEIAADACSVSLYIVGDRGARREKPKHDRNMVHTDTGGSSSPRDRIERRPMEKIECAVCKRGGHKAKECRLFQALSIDDRWKKIQTLDLCRTCLYNHGRRTCRSTKRCGVNSCQARHHPLLHSTTKTVQVSTLPTKVEHNVHHEIPSLLFRIIPVTLYSGENSVNTYAFLDEGSSLTMVESGLASKLGVRGYSKPLCLKWTANVTRDEKNSKKVSFEISGIGKPKRYRMNDVSTIDSLELPEQTLAVDDLKEKCAHLQRLPIEGYERATPQLLIGIDNLKLALPLKVREGYAGEPTAVKTRLGWCVYGGRKAAEAPLFSYHICECSGDQSLDEALKTYFTLEETGVTPTTAALSKDDERAMRIMGQTTVKKDGRYESGLLWKYDCFEFPESFPMAVKRLQCLERKMAKDSVLKTNIERQIEEYQSKGYAHRATMEELADADPRRTWYLPLGAVVNPKKPEKVRLIWDASAKVDGVSLNTMLLKGPDQLASLPTVLFRFRQYRVAVSADIKEMFHQVRIRPEDRHAQRFLWRSSPSDTPNIFLMDVATFGSTSSPATAQYVKNTNAQQFTMESPEAVDGIVRSHYVDDYVDSFPCDLEAMRVASEVRRIHEYGGFEIRNWCSNSTEVLQHLGENGKCLVKELNPEKNEASERVLGMLWETQSDEMRFPTTMRSDVTQLIENQTKPTKREILRCVMTLFDPLGVLAPYLIFGRILIQDVWRAGIGWDESVGEETFDRWRMWIDMVQHINQLRIPRAYFQASNESGPQFVQLHVFVDASELAYSCVAYFRMVNAEGEIEVALVAAKAKVAPLKPMSIPRLELQACVLGTRLMKFVGENHSFQITKRILWSDSSTALSWINGDPRKYRMVVATRVGEILETINREECRWVPSKQNPADEATKWGSGPYFKHNSIWFSGPEFLYVAEERWPEWKGAETTREELRPCYSHCEVRRPVPIIDFIRFRSWNRLLRTVAYVHRFIARYFKLPSVAEGSGNTLTQAELQKAEQSIFRVVQWESFPDEMTIMLHNQQLTSGNQRTLNKTSSIYQLTPMLDSKGVLRIDGRIGAARYAPVDLKYPVILPREHRLSILIVENLHRKFHHGNHETVVNEARQRFYIPRLRTLVRKVANSCSLCKIRKARPAVPRMGPLPQARLSPFVRPFTYVGVDYVGPFLVKVGRSRVKRWIALFSCMMIRAVHLELAFNLSTESCIMCFRRFISCRGSPVEVHSDNGTNFQGAERLLREQISEGLAATFTSTTTTWRFIPPGAPHMGGSWERLVRSVKAALSVYDNANLDDEGFLTFLAEAEAMVNSRPLTYLPVDSAEQEALTPNHFLMGSSSGAKQPVAEGNSENNLLKCSWRALQEELNRFWRRWIREYLPTLTKRTRWFGETRNMQPGDLVMVFDDTRRNGYMRGKVLEVITAKDGKVRQAVVQTSAGVLRRPVSKLAVLEVSDIGETEATHGSHRGEDVGTTASELATTLNGKSIDKSIDRSFIDHVTVAGDNCHR